VNLPVAGSYNSAVANSYQPTTSTSPLVRSVAVASVRPAAMQPVETKTWAWAGEIVQFAGCMVGYAEVYGVGVGVGVGRGVGLGVGLGVAVLEGCGEPLSPAAVSLATGDCSGQNDGTALGDSTSDASE
jgi:hypothetical protein